MSTDPIALAITNALSTNRFSIEPHARKRMNERGVQRADIVEVGRNCYDVESQENGKFKVFGDDLSGIPLNVVCVYESEAVIVSVMGD